MNISNVELRMKPYTCMSTKNKNLQILNFKEVVIFNFVAISYHYEPVFLISIISCKTDSKFVTMPHAAIS